MALLNEVVCALAGHPGEVFGATDKDVFGAWTEAYTPGSPETCPLGLVENENEDATTQNQTHGWDYVVGLGEKALINNLVKIGYHFREISRFATIESQPEPDLLEERGEGDVSTSKGREGRGGYRRAFAFGLLKVLSEYRQDILVMERKVKHKSENQVLPLTQLQSVFCEYDVLLQKLHRVICTISQEDIRGCHLLRYLEDLLVCGIPKVEMAMQVVVNYLYEVLYKQLGAWLVYGRLIDRRREFFIQRREREREAKERAGGDTCLSPEDVSIEEWHRGFGVNKDALPLHISEDTADMILFIGKAQRIMSHARNSWRKAGRSKSSAQWSLHLNNGEILGQLEKLHLSCEFSKPAFELFVNGLRKDVAAHMWQLVVAHADLPMHLQALKDYFLMERGNFYQVFLSEARSLMQSPPQLPAADSEIKNIFSQSAQRTGSESDPLFSNISVCMRNPDEEAKRKREAKSKIHLPSCDGWDNMCLKYSVSWPLGVVLTPDVLKRYHHMFQFLWRLRRVHVELDEVWTTLRRLAMRSRAHAEFSSSSQVWHLRHQMVHLICNLQIYVQVDVIETQYSILQKHIASAENFLDLENALNSFLHTLLTQSFLDISSITSMLDGVIKLCFKFCTSIHEQLENQSPLESLSLFSRIEDDFQRRCSMLFTVLKSTKLSISSRAPHLHQFLLRLNYNQYIAKLALESHSVHT